MQMFVTPRAKRALERIQEIAPVVEGSGGSARHVGAAFVERVRAGREPNLVLDTDDGEPRLRHVRDGAGPTPRQPDARYQPTDTGPPTGTPLR